jgi:hypothetical protein
MVRHQIANGRAHDWKVTLESVRGRWVIAGWENRDDAATPGFLKPEGAAGKPKAKAPAKAPAKPATGASR